MTTLSRPLGLSLSGGIVESILGADTGVNLLSAAASDFEGGASGWSNNNNAAVATSTTEALHGTHSLSLTAIQTVNFGGTPNDCGVISGFVAVQPSMQYTALASFFATAARRLGFIGVVWYNSSQTLISEPTSSTVLAAAQWTQVALSAVSPSNAAFARLSVAFFPLASGDTMPAGEVDYLDCISLAQGTSLVWGPGS